MTAGRSKGFARFTHGQLEWVTRLRWVAGVAIVVFTIGQAVTVGWFPRTLEMTAVGVAVLLFNLVVQRIEARLPESPSPRLLLAFAWTQILFDLLALTLLTLWTGAYNSPLLFLYVFHMVFASLLLSRSQAYAAALAAVVMFVAALLLAGQRPTERADRLMTIGWVFSLPVTVHLTNHLMRELFGSERARSRQRRRLTAMRRRLRAQRQRMLLHDRLVSIGQFAAGVAHEISNPLASMDGLLQLMERKPDVARPESISSLREQVRRIQRTVKQLTTLAHPDLGQTEATDVNQLIERTLETLAFDHRLRKVQLHSEFGDVGSVELVPRAIQQVLINMIINAVDAMEQTPQPQLTLRTSMRDGHCVIEIADNGPGVPAGERERIFKPFYTTKPAGSGTGLGLAISRGLVNDHGGSLTVTATPGGGATFVISLPARKPTPAEQPEHAAAG